MNEKLKSRKLWMTILTGVFTTLNSALHIVPDDTMHWLIGLMATYIGVQGGVDAIAAKK